MPMAPTPSAWDPSSGMTYGEWLRSKRIQVRPQGWSHSVKPKITEGVDAKGRRFKATLDELGNQTVETTDPPDSPTPGKERLHAHITLRP